MPRLRSSECQAAAVCCVEIHHSHSLWPPRATTDSQPPVAEGVISRGSSAGNIVSEMRVLSTREHSQQSCRGAQPALLSVAVTIVLLTIKFFWANHVHL